MVLNLPSTLSLSNRHRESANPNPTPISSMTAAQVSAMRAVAVGIPEWQAAKIRLHRPSTLAIINAKRFHALFTKKNPELDTRFRWGYVDDVVMEDLHAEGIVDQNTPANYVYPAYRQVEKQESDAFDTIIEYEKSLRLKRKFRGRIDAMRDALEPNSPTKKQRISILQRSFYTLMKQYDFRDMLEGEGVIEVGSLDGPGMQMERIDVACALENLRLESRGEMQELLQIFSRVV